ncbi:hypothetical protein KMW28_22160 [Flammeovirga yaeyamensis]|uniref:DinB-like domain-containing protein n=1 Tax=Flammeovirga yaeyamensis TaxID=367791 RepID=A0AAX1NC77_9BACT|nr:hypothetical protein [Flammeovirga yaeyamensis]MBB3696938.1 hypothetical protein [Flammeovirga yaeyamensis]NMF33601.1 DinB family protein [Flammeovirga yaeyamensis]QWG05131.1 hypothetical protein KMW28_22160 [Flammeovirga yaeyamensis]
MTELPYQSIPPLPEEINSTNIISRMIDGLGFRYYWGTEGLRTEDIDFRPEKDSRNTLELLGHIYDLAFAANKVLGGNATKKDLSSYIELRKETLILYKDLSDRLREMPDEDLENYNYMGSAQSFPFWYLLNGQIADALTHVGQIVSWRRISGNPQPKGVNVFLGRKS